MEKTGFLIPIPSVSFVFGGRMLSIHFTLKWTEAHNLLG